MKRMRSIACREVESDMNGSSQSLPSVINTLQQLSVTQRKGEGRSLHLLVIVFQKSIKTH